VHHTRGVVGVDPGEAAAGGDESGRVLCPGPTDSQPSWNRHLLTVGVDGKVNVKVVYREVVAEAGNAVDDLPLMQLLNVRVHVVRWGR